MPKPVIMKEGMTVEFIWDEQTFIGTISRWNPDKAFSDKNCCIKTREGAMFHFDNCLITKVFPEMKFRPIDILVGRLENNNAS